MAHSDWKLDSLTSSYVEEDTPWDDILNIINNEDDDNLDSRNSLQLVVEISRNTKILEKLFHIPLLRMISFSYLLQRYLIIKILKKIKLNYRTKREKQQIFNIYTIKLFSLSIHI